MNERQLLRVLASLVLGIATLFAVPVILEVAAFAAGHPFVVNLAERVSGPICHHLPERSLHLDGRQFPVCSRCTGMYLGYVLGLFGFFLASIARNRSSLGWGMAVLVALYAFGFAAALGEKVDFWRTSDVTRVGLGVALGVPASAMLTLWARAIAAAAVAAPPS